MFEQRIIAFKRLCLQWQLPRNHSSATLEDSRLRWGIHTVAIGCHGRYRTNRCHVTLATCVQTGIYTPEQVKRMVAATWIGGEYSARSKACTVGLGARA